MILWINNKIQHIHVYIRKTCPCNVYPLEPHFYIAKLRFAGEKNQRFSTEIFQFLKLKKSLYIAWACFRNEAANLGKLLNGNVSVMGVFVFLMRNNCSYFFLITYDYLSCLYDWQYCIFV